MGAVIEGLGWFGAVTILGGYLLFSAGKLPNGVVYQLVNLVGALAITVNVFAHHAMPSTIVNGIWAVIAAVVLVRMRAARRRAADAGPTGAAPVPIEAHVELPTTTMVLPVIGPALRESGAGVDRSPGARVSTPAEPSLQSGRPEQSGQSGQPSSMALADSVPVVTAAIAIALVTAARDEADRRLAAKLAADMRRADHASA